MLRSRSNTLLSVRQATQRNAGRVTAGDPDQGGHPARGCDQPSAVERRSARPGGGGRSPARDCPVPEGSGADAP
ncbi:hypothetical protein [Streptomyces sp. NPDC056160]|uniref:hypothetical protein n=1 Tax=Streptomyces sp. NPDC056160 TaxID=3345731 RepID=UPI0035DC09F0